MDHGKRDVEAETETVEQGRCEGTITRFLSSHNYIIVL